MSFFFVFIHSFYQRSCNNSSGDGANVFHPYVWTNEWIWLPSLGPSQGQSSGSFVCMCVCVCVCVCVVVSCWQPCVCVCVICCIVHFKSSVHLCLCLSSACTYLVLIFTFFAHILLLSVCVYVQLKVQIVYVCPLGLCAACCGVMTIYFLPPCTPTHTHPHLLDCHIQMQPFAGDVPRKCCPVIVLLCLPVVR